MENKNLLLAIAASMGFLFLWQFFVMPRFTKPPVVTTESIPTPTKETDVSSKSATLVAPQTAVKDTSDGPKIYLRDPQNEVVFSAAGGGIRHWLLKLKGQEFDLVHFPDTLPLPLSTFPDRHFQVSTQGNEAVAKATLEKGVRLTKTLKLSSEGFLHDYTLRFENPNNTAIELNDWTWGWGPSLGTVAPEMKENEGLVRALSLPKTKAVNHDAGDYPCGQWCGIDNRYFMVAFLPPEGHSPTLHVEGKKNETRVALKEKLTLLPKATAELHYQLYVGPKGFTQLKHYGKNLEQGVDFGYFSGLGKLILNALYLLKAKTGNYGWAIIILSLGLQVLVLPLTVKSLKSTMAMKRLQPRIAELQQKYKSDPKRLNVEMMNLYKNSGTNPFGGCLPMLLQLPIFWALFTTLRNAYELRGAPWVLWIKDLSAADPYKVLPIVMGGGMYLQQRLSGAVTDPMQRQMMIMMPIIFVVMFMNFASGLVLYWFMNSLFMIVFQYFYQRYQQNRVEVIPPR